MHRRRGGLQPARELQQEFAALPVADGEGPHARLDRAEDASSRAAAPGPPPARRRAWPAAAGPPPATRAARPASTAGPVPATPGRTPARRPAAWGRWPATACARRRARCRGGSRRAAAPPRAGPRPAPRAARAPRRPAAAPPARTAARGARAAPSARPPVYSGDRGEGVAGGRRHPQPVQHPGGLQHRLGLGQRPQADVGLEPLQQQHARRPGRPAAGARRRARPSARAPRARAGSPVVTMPALSTAGVAVIRTDQHDHADLAARREDPLDGQPPALQVSGDASAAARPARPGPARPPTRRPCGPAAPAVPGSGPRAAARVPLNPWCRVPSVCVPRDRRRRCAQPSAADPGKATLPPLQRTARTAASRSAPAASRRMPPTEAAHQVAVRARDVLLQVGGEPHGGRPGPAPGTAARSRPPRTPARRRGPPPCGPSRRGGPGARRTPAAPRPCAPAAAWPPTTP